MSRVTQSSALKFLQSHQPMPDEDDLTEELIDQYDAVREYCIEHPNPIFIPLLLNSFGEGSGLGVYQLVEDAFRSYSEVEIVPHLRKALASPVNSVRYWSAGIAGEYPSVELLPELKSLLTESDSDIRSAAFTAISRLGQGIANPILGEHLKVETDSDIICMIQTHLRDS